MAAYCADTDLLLTSNLPIPQGLSKMKYVQDAADEINMRIAQRYRVPIVFGTVQDQDAYQATLLLLKTLNVHLATGRLIMALDARGENESLHAYGADLVRGALALVREILDGKINLEGAASSSGADPEDKGTARPILRNLDPFSLVEDFYRPGERRTEPYLQPAAPPIGQPEAEPLPDLAELYRQIRGS